MSVLTDIACSRRSLLAGAGLAVLGAPRLAFGDTGGGGDLLVVVTLAGGADGLSLVPPLSDPAYATARPGVAVRVGQAHRLDRTFGLHPGLAPLLPHWNARRLAVVHAVGDADGTRSHFEASDAMCRGVNHHSTVRTGWIDRLMRAQGLTSRDFPALAIAGMTPRTLAGPAPELTTVDVRTLALAVEEGERARTERALAELYRGVGGPMADAARGTLSAVSTLSAVVRQRYAPRPGVAYPTNPFGSALQQVAQVAKAQVGLRVACVEVGGWDTHEAMGPASGGYLTRLISKLGSGLAAFADDLGPLLDGTTVVTVSEFGRRVAENGSGGVDHGHGSAMLVLGGGIRGGKVYGRWPGLGTSQLDDGDLRVVTDYRDVLGELVLRRLGGADLREVFPDHRVRPLGLARQRAL